MQKEEITISKWEEFFDSHAPEYLNNCFTKRTEAEVDFIEEVFSLSKGSHILDMGCGVGRHAVELALRGYEVTGVDLSSNMLKEAKRAAEEAGVTAHFIHDNAAHYRAHEKFDGAICLCEGAFSLLGEGDDPIERDLLVLKNISFSLKPDAPFLLTALNGFSKIRSFTDFDVERGIFRPEDMLDLSEVSFKREGIEKKMMVLERGYLPTEIRLMAHISHLVTEEIWGGTAGDWGRRRLKLDEIEIMYLFKKER